MDEEADDDLNTAEDEAAYECGWHDGCDYGYRLAEKELTCPRCAGRMEPPE